MELDYEAKLLIEAGSKFFYSATPRQRDLSPIFLACEKQNIDVLEHMYDHGAESNVRNSNNLTPIMFASEQGK